MVASSHLPRHSPSPFGGMPSLLDLTSQGDVGTISDESKLSSVTLMTPQQDQDGAHLWWLRDGEDVRVELFPDRRAAPAAAGVVYRPDLCDDCRLSPPAAQYGFCSLH